MEMEKDINIFPPFVPTSGQLTHWMEYYIITFSYAEAF